MICDGSSRQFFMLLSIIKNGREMNKPRRKTNRRDEEWNEVYYMRERWRNAESPALLLCVYCEIRNILCVRTQHSTSSHKWELLELRYDSWYFHLFLLIFRSYSGSFSFPPHSFCRSLHAWTCQLLRLDFGCKYCRSARVRARERKRMENWGWEKLRESQSQLVRLPDYWIWRKWNEKIKFTFLAIHGTHTYTQCQHRGDLGIG